MLKMTSKFVLPFVLLLCVHSSVAVITVGVLNCTKESLIWYVSGGEVGGATYLETSTNTACVFNITDATNQTFTADYTTCGASPSISLAGDLLEVVVPVMSTHIFNTAVDTRYLVECNFMENTQSISFNVQLVSNDQNAGTNKVTHTVTPVPIMTLYKRDLATNTETATVSTDVITLGEPMKLEISLLVPLPTYQLQVGTCSVRASRIGSTTILGQLQVTQLDGCPIYPNIYEEFVYTYDAAKENSPLAANTFLLFMPQAPQFNLRNETVQLRFICQVKACITLGGTCTHPTCTAARKKRQVEEGPQEGEFLLEQAILVKYGDENALQDNEVIVPQALPFPNQDTNICVNKGDFWAGLLSLLALLIAAIAAACCLCFGWCTCCRCRRKRKYIEERFSTYSSASPTSAGSVVSLPPPETITEKPMNKLFFLPRFVPARTNSEKALGI